MVKVKVLDFVKRGGAGRTRTVYRRGCGETEIDREEWEAQTPQPKPVFGKFAKSQRCGIYRFGRRLQTEATAKLRGVQGYSDPHP